MTDGARTERLIENEKRFRAANERLHERVDQFVESDQQIPFLCECADETCMARVDLSLDDYERVRTDDDHFVIKPGHPLLDGERIVEGNDGFVIITKADLYVG